MSQQLLRKISPQKNGALTEIALDFALPLENRTLKLPFGVRDRTWDAYIANGVVVGDEYRVSRYAGSKAVVLDVGAHIGSFATTVKRAFPDSRVIALEAADFNVPVLAHNLTYAPEIEAFYNAIGSKDGDLIHVPNACGPNTGGNGCVPHTQQGASTHTVTLATLAKTLGVERFDVVKLDCEGGEHALLADAASAELLAQAAYVTAEIHGHLKAVHDWFLARFSSVEFLPHPDVPAKLAHLYARR
jgi:FkbM family methyltransferase